jgi:GntR family transcriptional regulator
MIQREGPVAPWRQLAALLRGRIEAGELPPGARLPSIVSLAQEYGLAVTTVQKAVGALKDDGLIVTSPMGTFVSEDQGPG